MTPPWPPSDPYGHLYAPLGMPVPLANCRTGKVSIPTIWSALAERVLDPAENDSTRDLCARTLAELIRSAS